MIRRIFKAIIRGAFFAALLTAVVQGCALTFGRGETAMGWILMGPWFVVFAPASLLAKVIGWHWQVGSVYDITLPIFMFALLVNALIGAFWGWAFWFSFCLPKYDR